MPNIPDFLPPSSPDPKIPKNLNVPEMRPKPGEGDEWLGERTDQEYFFPFSDKHRDVDWKLPRWQINLDRNLKNVFREGETVLNEPLLEPTAPPLDVYFTDFSGQLDRGETPEEIQFYRGGEGVNQLQREIINSGLEIGNESFVEFFFCKRRMSVCFSKRWNKRTCTYWTNIC